MILFKNTNKNFFQLNCLNHNLNIENTIDRSTSSLDDLREKIYQKAKKKNPKLTRKKAFDMMQNFLPVGDWDFEKDNPKF